MDDETFRQLQTMANVVIALAAPVPDAMAADPEARIKEAMRLAREAGDIERRHCIGKAQGFDVRDAYASILHSLARNQPGFNSWEKDNARRDSETQRQWNEGRPK